MHSFQTGHHDPMYFERQYNLQYIFSNPEDHEEKAGGGGFWGKNSSVSRKTDAPCYRNILIYDIPKDLQLWLFKPGEIGEEEYISNLVYELFYDQKQSNMAFSIYSGNVLSNNFNLEKRPVSDRILIQTQYKNKQESRLWISDKWGFEKRVLSNLTKDAFWQLDAFNRVLRVYEKEKNGQYKIQNFDY